MTTAKVYALGLGMLLPVFVVAQSDTEVNAPVAAFELLVDLSQKRLLPYEPLYVSYTLCNTSGVEQARVVAGGVSLQMRGPGETEWQTVSNQGQIIPASRVPRKRVFAPGEKSIGGFRIHTDLSGQHYFRQAGRYHIQIGSQLAESKEVLIEIEHPDGEDLRAGQVVRDKQLYLWFDEHIASLSLLTLDKNHPHDPLPQLTELIERFPKSRYAQWAKLGRMWVKKERAGQDAALAEVQKEMEQLAPTLAHPINALCWYGAGVAAFRRGDCENGEGHFAKTVTAGQSAYFTNMVAHMKPLVRRKEL